ncbi:MAG: hypothetical protein HYY83_05295 [Deltaproteobacteria bacterium]|nr:hypothetical protein [Deltaproteobacteria bacterium]
MVGLRVTVQSADVPPQPPLHSLKLAPAAGASVSVTAFTVNVAEHDEEQLIPAGLLVTVPVPEPLTVDGLNTVTSAVPAVAMSLEEIVACSLVPLTKVVVRFELFQRTTDADTKLLPVTVSVNPAPPVVALLGESEAAAGTGWLMVKVRAADVPPPGRGSNAVISAVPAVAMSLEEMAACNWVLLTNVVVRFEPFQRTTDVDTKLLPVTVSVNPAPPAVALLGESAVSAGTGLVPVPVSPRNTLPPL